jgi:hypothetical protein
MDIHHSHGQDDAQKLSSEHFDHGLCIGDCNDPDWLVGRDHLSSQPIHDDAEHLSPNVEKCSLTAPVFEGEDDLDLDFQAFERQMSIMGIIPHGSDEGEQAADEAEEKEQHTPCLVPLNLPAVATTGAREENTSGQEAQESAGSTTIHKAYEKLHHPVEDGLVDKMRIALGEIPPVFGPSFFM